MFVVPLFYALFNGMLTSGHFPDGWCNAIIHPIHKKGSWTDQGNYRGISLLSSVSKVFTKLVTDYRNGEMMKKKSVTFKQALGLERALLITCLYAKA